MVASGPTAGCSAPIGASRPVTGGGAQKPRSPELRASETYLSLFGLGSSMRLRIPYVGSIRVENVSGYGACSTVDKASLVHSGIEIYSTYSYINSKPPPLDESFSWPYAYAQLHLQIPWAPLAVDVESRNDESLRPFQPPNSIILPPKQHRMFLLTG